MIKSREAGDHAGWELIRQGTLSTLSPGMRYSVWRGQSGKIYGETQSAFFDIADSEEAFAALSSEELEEIIYSSERSVSR